MLARRVRNGRCPHFLVISLSCFFIQSSLFFLRNVPKTKAAIVEKLSILPTFNEGMNSQLSDPRNKRIMAKILSAQVSYTKENVKVQIEYEVHTTEFYTNCFLNGSEAMAEFIKYNLQKKKHAGEYEADIYLKRLRQYGILMLSFQLTTRTLTDKLMVQYSINLQDRGNRAITSGCPSTFHIFPSIKTMIIQFWIDEFTPMGINWEQIVLMKRIHVRATGVSLIHLPLFVVTRTPFTVKFLTLWSFQDFVASFGADGFLRLQGSTMASIGAQESGGYTIRWFIPERQHLIDEFCPDQLPRLPVSAGSALFFYVDPEQQERWSYDIDKLSRLVSKRKTLTLYVACVMDDVFQDLPRDKTFVVVVKKKMFYSDGDDLGYLGYVYNVTLNSPTLNNFDCITKTTGDVPFIPLTRIDEAGVYPPIAGTPLATRLVLTITLACTSLNREVTVDEVYLSGPQPSDKRTDLELDTKVWSVCKTPRKNFEFILPTWEKDAVYTITASLSPGGITMQKAVILGPYDQLTVRPSFAFADQTVEIICFQDLLKKLSAPSDQFAAFFAPNAVEYIFLEGLNQTEYLPLLTFTPKKKYVLKTENIDSSAVIVNVNDTDHAYVHLRVLARHLTNFSGFRCRLKMNNVFNQEYSVINREPVCFVLRPPRLRIAIEHVFLPKTKVEISMDNSRMEVYQLSCVKPGGDLEVSCKQKYDVVECADCPKLEKYFDSTISVLVAMDKTNTTREYEPVVDRRGRANVMLKKLTLKWHLAQLICRQTLFTKRLSAQEKKTIAYVQFSASARLCVSRLRFAFYKLQDGFNLMSGLTTTVERAKKLAKSELLSTDLMYDLPERSAILCEVSTDDNVHNTTMTVRSGVGNFNASSFELANASLLVLPPFTQELLNQPITVTCGTVRNKSLIPAFSKHLRFVITPKTFKKGDEFNEFVLLMKMVSSSLLIGFLIAILCPLFTMMADRRYEKRKLEKRREKQKAIESLLNLKLDVEKEEKEAKTMTKTVDKAATGGRRGVGEVAGEGGDEGKVGSSSEQAATKRSTDKHVRSHRQSLAILGEIMRAQAMKRTSNYSTHLSGSYSRGRSAETKDSDETEGSETPVQKTKRLTELRKQAQSTGNSVTDSGSHSHKKSRTAISRTKTLRVTRPTHKGSVD